MHFYRVCLNGEDQPRMVMAANKAKAYEHAVSGFAPQCRPLSRSIDLVTIDAHWR